MTEAEALRERPQRCRHSAQQYATEVGQSLLEWRSSSIARPNRWKASPARQAEQNGGNFDGFARPYGSHPHQAETL